MTPLPKVPTHMDTDNTYTSANANSEVAVNDIDGMDGIAISVGDSVNITGLLSDHQYNGTRGIVVSAVDPKTNRCGVRINADKTLALRVQNLSVVRWAKTGNRGVVSRRHYETVGIPREILADTNDKEATATRHVMVAGTFCDKDSRSALKKQNMNLLRNVRDECYEDVIKLEKTRNFEFLLENTRSIIGKWRHQASMGFIRFLDGTTTNCKADNLLFVSLRDALDHIDEWTVDWDIDLTLKEIYLVKHASWREVFLRLTSVDIDHEVIEEEEGIKSEESEATVFSHGDLAEAATHQRHTSSSPAANNRGLGSTRIVPTTDFAHANSHNTKYAARIMKVFRKCKKNAMKVVLSSIFSSSSTFSSDCESFQQALLYHGLLSVVLRFLMRCEQEDFKDVVGSVKGNLQTPTDWVEILTWFTRFEKCKLEIANGVRAIIPCMCDDTKRQFFKSNKYWHEGIPPFVGLVDNLLNRSSQSTSTKAGHILLQNKGFLESMVQMGFWSAYRPDILKESKSYLITKSIDCVEDFARKATKGLIAMGIVKSLSPTYAEHFTKDGLDRLKVIAATPVVSRAYDASCKVLFVVGMIRMLKGFKSDDPQDREDFFHTLFMFTTNTASTMRLLPK